MANTISNSDDVIDSRDVIARIEELREEREDYTHDDDGNLTNADWEADFPDDAAELAALEALAEEAAGYAPDWTYGETLIRDSYFEEYARELAEDLGMLDKGDRWPHTCIDWERAADELKQDYTAVDFDEVTYWVRY